MPANSPGTPLQLRGGPAAEVETKTGIPREIVVDETAQTLVLMDGATPGGHALARADGGNVLAATFRTALGLGAAALKTPGAAGNLDATTLQGAVPTDFASAGHGHAPAGVTGLQAALDAKAPAVSPQLSGTPTTPTPALADDSKTIINSEWVAGQGYAKAHDAALTGAPVAPTPALGTTTNQVANAPYVNAMVSQAPPYWGVAGGTANAIVLTTGLGLTALRVGSVISFDAATANTAAVTVVIDGMPALALNDAAGIALASGALAPARTVTAVFTGAQLRMLGALASALTVSHTAPIYLPSGGTTTITGGAVIAVHEQIAGQTFNLSYNTRADYQEQDAINGTDWVAGSFGLHAGGSVPSGAQLLLHMDADWADASPNGIVLTNAGATIGATNKVFGSGCGQFVSGRVYYNGSHAAFQFGSGDFEVEFRFTATSNGSSVIIDFGTTYNTSNGFCIYLDGAGNIGVWTGNSWLFYTPISLNTPYVGAISRVSGLMILRLNGVTKCTATCTTNFSDGRFSLGRSYDDHFQFSGQVDELIVVKGGVLHATDYAPASSAYSTYVTGPYYVTTLNASQINFSTYDAIAGVTVTATEPAGTSLRFLVSFDGRVSWYTYSGGVWTSVALTAAAIQASGLTIAQLQTALAAWTPALGTTLDVAASFRTTNISVTPTLDNILVTMDRFRQMTPGIDYDASETQTGGPHTVSLTRLKIGSAMHRIYYV